MIMSRVYNFSAGPAVLPEEVLKEAADEMLDYQGSGMSEIIAIKNEHQYSSMTSDLLEVQGDGVLCIIIDKKGSTPRTVGSMMFINEKGIIGSIGGGREEYQAILDAKNCHEVMMKHYELNNSESANLGMICGGSNDVLFLPIKQH